MSGLLTQEQLEDRLRQVREQASVAQSSAAGLGDGPVRGRGVDQPGVQAEQATGAADRGVDGPGRARASAVDHADRNGDTPQAGGGAVAWSQAAVGVAGAETERGAGSVGADAPDAVLSPSRESTVSYRYVRPLADAADDLIDTFTNVDGRFMLGFRDLDLKMRGIGRGELALFTGFAHSGKTQLTLASILNQRHLNVLWFSPDETATQVLAKLFSMIEGIDGGVVERRVKDGDKATVEAIHRVASEALENLIVIDEVLSLDDMTLALDECETYWGSRFGPRCRSEAGMVGLDFLGLLAKGAEYSDLSSSSKAVKRWVKGIDRPAVVIHQGSRGGAGKGKELTLQSMSYAGEAEATFVLGVRRKFFDESLSAEERQIWEPSLTVQLLKNKRVSGGLGEVDLYLDMVSGQVRELHPEDLKPKVPSRENNWTVEHDQFGKLQDF